MHGDSQILSDCEAGIKFVMAKRHYQHARRVRSPDKNKPRS
jgi:hypothetical protein